MGVERRRGSNYRSPREKLVGEMNRHHILFQDIEKANSSGIRRISETNPTPETKAAAMDLAAQREKKGGLLADAAWVQTLIELPEVSDALAMKLWERKQQIADSKENPSEEKPKEQIAADSSLLKELAGIETPPELDDQARLEDLYAAKISPEAEIKAKEAESEILLKSLFDTIQRWDARISESQISDELKAVIKKIATDFESYERVATDAEWFQALMRNPDISPATLRDVWTDKDESHYRFCDPPEETT